jgi:hypothetical protein
MDPFGAEKWYLIYIYIRIFSRHGLVEGSEYDIFYDYKINLSTRTNLASNLVTIIEKAVQLISCPLPSSIMHIKSRKWRRRSYVLLIGEIIAEQQNRRPRKNRNLVRRIQLEEISLRVNYSLKQYNSFG